jgi:hypothetical protein
MKSMSRRLKLPCLGVRFCRIAEKFSDSANAESLVERGLTPWVYRVDTPGV